VTTARRTFLAGVAAALAGCGREPREAAPGPVADAVGLLAFDGRVQHLAAWRGRRLVVNVWASWCAPCRAELPSLQALSDRLDATRATVIGLAVDDDHHLVREFLRRTPVRFPVYLQAPGPSAQRAWGVRALPETLLFGADGELVGREGGARDWTDRALLARWDLPLRAGAAEGADA